MAIANEQDLFSAVMTAFPPVRKVLVIAPHPDDEVFGCGGTVSLLCGCGCVVTTIIVTDGALGGDNTDGKLIETRAEESRAAADRLKLGAPIFWGLPDRGVEYGEVLIGRLVETLLETGADLVFLPSPTEWHPDHQAIAFAGAEAIRRLGGERRAAFYEVSAPLPSANLIFDISAAEEEKRQAMRCFPSQLRELPYDTRISGINSYRALHLGAQARSAEAFTLLAATDFEKGGALLLDGPLAHRRNLGFATSGGDLPLVSVIIRSMDRPTLVDTLDSLALQTYSNIEVVLVNAKGAAHRKIEQRCGRFPLRFIDSDEPLRRSRAANRGLDATQGEYLIFLDDDDWFDTNHIQNLATAIGKYPETKAVYAGVRCVDEKKNPLPNKFDAPFDAVQIVAGNFIPIHAVLFSRSLIERGCRLDESLDLYEDWDFWIQLSRHCDFLRIDGLSAVYRIAQHAGFGVNADPVVAASAALALYRKWLNRLDDRQITGLMQTVRNDPLKDGQISGLHQAVVERDGQIASLDQTVADLSHDLAERDRQVAILSATVTDRDVQVAGLVQTVANLNRGVIERDGQIANLSQTVTERDRQIDNLTQAITGRDGQIASLTRAITERDRQVAGLHQTVTVRDGQVTRLSQTLASLEQSALARDVQITTFVHAVAERDGQIASLRQTLDGLNRGVIVRDGQIADLTRAAAEHAERAASLIQTMIERDGRVADLDNALFARDEQIANLAQAVHDKEVHIGNLDHALRAGREQIGSLIQSVAEIRGSTSWRLTSPVRFVGHRLLRIKIVLKALPYALSACGGYRGLVRHVWRTRKDEGIAGIKRRILFSASRGTPLPVIDHITDGTQPDHNDYDEWVRRYDTLTDHDRERIRIRIDNLQRQPFISVVMPVYNPPLNMLEDAIRSVQCQLYPNWELCIADDASTDAGVRKLLQRYADNDSRIKVVFRKENGHISAASNSAFGLVRGEYVALFDNDDLLREHALFWVADAIVANPDAGLIYSDEDKVDQSGRYGPYFKPDWNPDLFRSHNLICHLGVYRADLVRKLGGFREGYEGAQDYDLALRCTEQLAPRQIVHIPRVLYTTGAAIREAPRKQEVKRTTRCRLESAP